MKKKKKKMSGTKSFMLFRYISVKIKRRIRSINFLETLKKLTE